MMYGDATTNKLLNNGVYSVHNEDVTEERRPFERREHNFLSGMWYVFILSILLWWLPLFGQMIAGYLGGRKAGTPIKGVIVAVIPVFIIVLFMVGMDMGMLPFLGTIAGIPTMIMNGIQGFSPNAAYYISGIYTSLRSLVGLNANGFFIIVVFGLIGGMMADMNRKEIIHATGNEHFYDAMFGRFSGASLSKFADMVAERVIWTLGMIDHGGRNLIGRLHSEPNAFAFGELRKLPAPSAAYALPAHSGGPSSYQPENAFGYDAQPNRDDEFMHMRNIAPKGPPVTYSSKRDPQDSFLQMKNITPTGPQMRSRKEQQYPLEEEWGISHRDLSEESLIKTWKEHERNIERGKYGPRYRRDVNKASEKLYGKKNPAKTKPKDKRDALIYDNKGNLIDKSKTPKKALSKSSKQKMPSLVTRALIADKEVMAKAREKTPQTALSVEQKDETRRPVKTKSTQSYDRL